MPQRKCRLILMAPASGNIDKDKTALTKALDGGDVAAIVVAADTPGFPPLGEEILKQAQARDIACLNSKTPESDDLCGFDGVLLAKNSDAHLIRQTRQMLGEDALIGAMAGGSRDEAMQRGEAGVDYLSFGPQEGEEIPSLELISWWCDLFVIPCAATGAITLQNAAPLVKSGVDFLMLPGDIWLNHEDPGSLISAFNQLIEDASTT